MLQIQRFNKVLKTSVIIGDLVILNVLFISLYSIWNEVIGQSIRIGALPQTLSLFNLCYFACAAYGGVVLHHRGSRADQVMLRVLRNMFFFILLTMSVYSFAGYGDEIPIRFFISFFIVLAIALISFRLFFHSCIQAYRSRGGNTRLVVLLGSAENVMELFREMTADRSTGYRVVGYFDSYPNFKFSEKCPYLGTPDEVKEYLEAKHIEQVYCCWPSAMSHYIVPIINYCENHLVQFYSVPNVRNYLRHRMHLGAIGNVPILSLRNEPLNQTENKIMKRTFDIVFSLCFLCTFFLPIYLVVGIIIKTTSPGPIFFKQKRNGLNGKEFWCYKFRSMKVNNDADKVQATAHDPRKTKFGDFMRKTSIDELPQFINVLLGDMSIVGPRPHMLKHTEEYSAIINKYMVRHFIKPGITGWAQVTGFRGETKHVEEMEGRVKADIWYMEHWTFLLDLYIIYKTVANAVKRDKQAY